MMSSGSFAAPNAGPFSYEASPGTAPGTGTGPRSGFGLHPHHHNQQQPLPLPLDDTSVTEPIILDIDSTFQIPSGSPSASQPPHVLNPFNTTQQGHQNEHHEAANLQLQLQHLQTTLTQALSERDSARLSLATLRNELYSARQVEKRLRIERDEARAQVSFLKKERTQARQTETRLRRERNEARVALAVQVAASGKGGKVKGLGLGNMSLPGMGMGEGKVKARAEAQGGIKGIEMLLGTGAGTRTRTAGAKQGVISNASQAHGQGQGLPGQQQLPQDLESLGQQAGAGTAAIGLEGTSGAIADCGISLQQGFGHGGDMDQQLEEFLIMHGVDSREASPVQQVPTPPGMGYGHEVGTEGQFDMMQS